MKALFKLCILTIAFLIFFVMTGIIWLQKLDIQLIIFAIASFFLILRRGARAYLKELYLLLPFILSLAAVYLIFALLGFKPANAPGSALAYWVSYGGVRVLVLMSVIFAIQLLSSLISWQDILKLPLSISKLKYLILGKSLYEMAFSSFAGITRHLSLIPGNQIRPKSLKSKFQLRLAYLLALLYIVLSESERKGELIDNRIKHCHRRHNEMV